MSYFSRVKSAVEDRIIQLTLDHESSISDNLTNHERRYTKLLQAYDYKGRETQALVKAYHGLKKELESVTWPA